MKNGLVILNIFFALSSLVPFNFNNDVKFDNSSISGDFYNSTFDIESINQSKDVLFLDFIEYCYGNYNYNLYYYIYIPETFAFDTNSSLNKISLDINNDGYYKYQSILLDTDTNIYKFKVNLNENKRIELLDRKIDNNREYNISGFELKYLNNINSEEYMIGGKYIYSGYANGINGNVESTLNREVEDSETIKLDVKDLTYRFDRYTYSAYINDKYQLNSVYFSVPNHYLNEYGKLTNIKAEYYQYRTSPIFVVRDGIYDYFSDYVGTQISETSNPGYSLYAPYSTITSPSLVDNVFFYDYSNGFNENYFSNLLQLNVTKTNSISYLFNGGSDGFNDISSEELKNYIYNFDKSYFTGENYKGLSNDLFDLENSKGYQVVEISSDDNLMFKEQLSLWESIKILFGSDFIKEKEIACIEEVDSNNLDKDKLYIDSNDFTDFSNDVIEAKNKEESTFIFRFDLSQYYAWNIYDMKYGDLLYEGVDGYVAQQNVYLDFDIISLTFSKEGSSAIIPVVSNPIDIISDIEAPEFNNSFWSKLLQIFKIVILCILSFIGLWLVKFILELFGISLKDIFNFVFVKPIKWIKEKLSGKGKSKKKK